MKRATSSIRKHPLGRVEGEKIDATPAYTGRGGNSSSVSPYGSPACTTEAAVNSRTGRGAERQQQEEARKNRLAELEAQCNRNRGTDCNSPETLRYLESTQIRGIATDPAQVPVAHPGPWSAAAGLLRRTPAAHSPIARAGARSIRARAGTQHSDGGRGGDDDVRSRAQPACPHDAAVGDDQHAAAHGIPSVSACRCACASATSRARLWRISASALIALELGPVLAQLGERSRQELRPLRRPRRASEAGRDSADGEEPGQHPDRKEAIGVPEQHHEEEHEKDDRQGDTQPGSRGEHRDSRQRVLSSSISLAKISMRVCTSATKVLARFLRDSNKPSARGFSAMASLSGADQESERDPDQAAIPTPARDSRDVVVGGVAAARACSAASSPSGPSLSFAESRVSCIFARAAPAVSPAFPPSRAAAPRRRR